MDHSHVALFIMSVLGLIFSSVSLAILIMRDRQSCQKEEDEPQAYMYDEERIEMARAQIADSIGPGPMADNLARLRVGTKTRRS